MVNDRRTHGVGWISAVVVAAMAVSGCAQRILHLDPPSAALDATDAIWAFFAAHAKQPAT